MKTALLLSGGMDSTAIAYWKKPSAAITINYGQVPASAEIRAASDVAEALNIEHFIVKSDLSSLGSGDMAGSTPLDIAPVTEWWPFRNQLLITLAAMKAVQIGVKKIIIGTLKTDKCHADGTNQFITAMNVLLNKQEGELSLEAPAITLSASELIIKSGVPHEVLAWSHSCHISDYACGVCRGCRKHYETMESLKIKPY